MMKKLSAWLFLVIAVVWALNTIPGLSLGLMGHIIATAALLVIAINEIKSKK